MTEQLQKIKITSLMKLTIEHKFKVSINLLYAEGINVLMVLRY